MKDVYRNQKLCLLSLDTFLSNQRTKRNRGTLESISLEICHDLRRRLERFVIWDMRERTGDLSEKADNFSERTGDLRESTGRFKRRHHQFCTKRSSKHRNENTAKITANICHSWAFHL